MSDEIKVGDKVLIVAEATVLRVSDAHGLCYQVNINGNEKEYQQGARTVFIEPDEVVLLLDK